MSKRSASDPIQSNFDPFLVKTRFHQRAPRSNINSVAHLSVILTHITSHILVYPAMDTATASPQYGEHAQPSSRPSSGYAFLNHSSMTVPNNLPPNADDQLATRYKRRRTRFVASTVSNWITTDILQVRKTRRSLRPPIPVIQSLTRQSVWSSSNWLRWARRKSKYVGHIEMGPATCN